ncbi:MAG: histidine kinase [Saprospiraceae bacterium]
MAIRILNTITLLYFTVFISYCLGQGQGYVSYTNKNGLPSNNVYSIKQDGKGFVWATTDKGVVKFDGRKFTLFTVEQGLASNDNFSMLIDSKDNVWLYSFVAISKIEPTGNIKQFGNTKNYYSYFFLNSKDEIFYSVLENLNSYSNKGKYSHYIIRNNSVININLPNNFTTSYAQLFKDDLVILGNKTNNKFENYLVESNSKISLTNLYRFDFLDNNKTGYLAEIYLDKTYECAFSQHNYEILKKGNRYISKKYPFMITKKSNSNIIKYNELLYMVFNKGIYTYDINKDKWHPFLQNPKATSVLIDQERNVWVSTMGNGIIKYANMDLMSGNQKIEIITGESIKLINGLDKSHLWVVTASNEVKDMKGVKRKFYPDLIDLRFILADDKGNVYYGGSNGAYKNKKLIEQFGFKSSSLFKDSIAFTTSFGINFLNINDIHPFHTSGKTQMVDVTGRYYAVLLLMGKFYAGNQDGLFFGHPQRKELIPICLDENEESISVNGIKMSSDSLLWVATEGNGVYVLKNDVVIRHFIDELLDANIHSLKIDEKNRVWIATRKGVNLIRAVHNRFTVTGYNSYHGLPDDYINDIYCYDDTLYIASENGLARAKVADLIGDTVRYLPPIHIEGMKYLNQHWYKLDMTTNCTLEHNENNINIEYSGISFKSNGNIKFIYRLLPDVKEWIETTSDNITFNNLKPNSYVFEVKAIDAIGNVSKKPAAMRFTIKKHFTDTLWFSLLMWGLGMSILFLAIWNYLSRRRAAIEETRRIEKLISELKLQSLQAQLNPHFIFNSLNAIQQFINVENKKAANDYLSKFARLMRLYLNGSDTQFITLSQEMEVIKLYCSLEHLRFDDKFEYKIYIEENLDLDEYKVPAMLLQPYVENAIRHGLVPSNNQNNYLNISVMSMIGGIHCIIEDNGIGRSKSQEIKKSKISDHKSMGNKLSNERLEVIRTLKLGFIKETISDLTNAQEGPCGTRVEIFITKANV